MTTTSNSNEKLLSLLAAGLTNIDTMFANVRDNELATAIASLERWRGSVIRTLSTENDADTGALLRDGIKFVEHLLSILDIEHVAQIIDQLEKWHGDAARLLLNETSNTTMTSTPPIPSPNASSRRVRRSLLVYLGLFGLLGFFGFTDPAYFAFFAFLPAKREP